MREMNMPGLQQYIVVKHPVIPSDLTFQSLRVKVSIKNKSDGFEIEAGWHTTVLPLLPGEWYKIKNIIYGTKISGIFGGNAVISLELHRSKTDRKWIKDKILVNVNSLLDNLKVNNLLTQLNMDNYTIQAQMKDSSIYCLAQDLNSKVILVDTIEEAQKLSKQICKHEEQTAADKRWSLLLSEQ